MCLAHPGVTEQIQWGADAVFKVGGKMFAVACTDPAYPNAKACSFKCDDEGFAELCERDGVVPAPYLARAKWVAMDRGACCPIAKWPPGSPGVHNRARRPDEEGAGRAGNWRRRETAGIDARLEEDLGARYSGRRPAVRPASSPPAYTAGMWR